MNVVCTTESVEYPTTFLTGIPFFAAYSTSILFTPVAVSQINLNLVDYTDVAWTGGTDWFTAYVYPDNASVKAVNWKSSDYSVADVDPDGYVYFKDPGVAYVWCEGADGNVYQERRIVSLPEADQIALNEGIPVRNERDLNQLLEDYLS